MTVIRGAGRRLLPRQVIPRHRALAGWLLATFSVLFGASSAVGANTAEDDLRLLEGMRQRRLYTLAGDLCRQRLEDPGISERERVDFTVQWMRVLGEKGLHLRDGERQATWDEAHAAGAAFLQQHPENPRRFLVQLQEGLLWLTEGEVLRQEAEIDRRGEPTFESALERFRESARRLETLQGELREAALDPRRAGGQPDALTADELFSLGSHAQLLAARVYRNRAECYPADSDDRIAAATHALQSLAQLLTQAAADEPLAWEGRIEQLVCHRLLESTAETERLLEMFRKAQLPRSLRGRIHAEAARAALARTTLEEARRWVELSLSPSDPGAADLDLARLETFVVAWQAVPIGQDDERTAWRQRTLSLARYIAESHGRYWGRRADQLLLGRVQGSVDAGDVEILRRQADELYLQGSWEDAVAIYDEAAEAAEGGGLEDELFRCRYRAGLIQEKRGEYQDSLLRLRKVSRELPEHPDASSAHLAAIQVAVQYVRQVPDQLPLYEQLLREHGALWPRAASTQQANLWLGRLLRHQKRWMEAIEAYRQIDPDLVEAAEILDGLVFGWQGLLSQLQADGREADVQLRLDEAERDLQAFTARAGLSMTDLAPALAASARRELVGSATVAVARLLLEFAPERAAEAEQSLIRLMADGEPAEEAAWRAEAETWLFLARALQPGRQEAAERWLQGLERSDSRQLGHLLNQLVVASANRPALQRRLGQFQLDLIRRLESRSDLDTALAAELPRHRAAALVAVGDLEEARAAYRQLVADHPRDGGLQVAYARLLSESSDAEVLGEALRQWRIVADRSRPHTDDWFAAKYAVAETLWKLGQKDEAAKLIRYLQVTSPLRDSDWNTSFAELLMRCQK
jgi:tetratricopeptide (TPR) repeat protein